MSSSFTQLKKYFGYLSRNYTAINAHGYLQYYHTRGWLLKQQANCKTLSNFGRSTHTGCVKLGIPNTFADHDPDLNQFNNAYELVRKAFCHTNDKRLVGVMNWSSKVLDYNVRDGKKNRGLMVLKAFKLLLENEEISSEKLLQACILGWCVELLQGFILVYDDIMDNSKTRRGKPCWYKMPDVGLIAVNDSFLLEYGIYKILKNYFPKSDVYNNILHEFLQAAHKTVYGQCLDMLNVPPRAKRISENFNLEKYHAIIENKSAFYTYCLPLRLALHLVGNFTEKEFEVTTDIGLKLGTLYQIQDDYLDIFGDPDTTGKIGTDIINGKCTWFSATAFEQAPESMKEIMIENYGVNNPDAVSRIMKMYKELKLEEKYYECEESLKREITLIVKGLSRKSFQNLFFELLEKLNRRKK